MRYRYGADGSPQEAASLTAKEERCALLIGPHGATVRASTHTGYYLAEHAKTGRAKCPPPVAVGTRRLGRATARSPGLPGSSPGPVAAQAALP